LGREIYFSTRSRLKFLSNAILSAVSEPVKHSLKNVFEIKTSKDGKVCIVFAFFRGRTVSFWVSIVGRARMSIKLREESLNYCDGNMM